MCHHWHMTTSTKPKQMTLAELIRNAREDKGLSRDSLAHTVGSSLSTITRIELNHNMANIATLNRIAAELDIASDVLMAAAENTEALLAERKRA